MAFLVISVVPCGTSDTGLRRRCIRQALMCVVYVWCLCTLASDCCAQQAQGSFSICTLQHRHYPEKPNQPHMYIARACRERSTFRRYLLHNQSSPNLLDRPTCQWHNYIVDSDELKSHIQRSYIRLHSSKVEVCLAAALSQCLLGACACFIATVAAEQQQCNCKSTDVRSKLNGRDCAQ